MLYFKIYSQNSLTTRFSYPLHLFFCNRYTIFRYPKKIKLRLNFTQWFLLLSRNTIFLHTELFFPFCEPIQLVVFAVLLYFTSYENINTLSSLDSHRHLHTHVTAWIFICQMDRCIVIACDSISTNITVCQCKLFETNKTIIIWNTQILRTFNPWL